MFLYLKIIGSRQSVLKINRLNLAHTSTSELKTESGADKTKTSDHYEERLGFHKVGFLTGEREMENFFLFGSMLN